MKEREIRDRINGFLRDTLRTVVVPASMGLGVALTGCSDASDQVPDGGFNAGALTSTATSTDAVAVYSAPMSDTLTDTGIGTMVTKYMAPVPDAGVPTKSSTSTGTSTLSSPVRDAGAPTKSSTSTGTSTLSIAPAYMAPQPRIESKTETYITEMGPAYMAPQPWIRTATAIRWITQLKTSTLTETDSAVAVYSAPVPTATQTATSTFSVAPAYMAPHPDGGAITYKSAGTPSSTHSPVTK